MGPITGITLGLPPNNPLSLSRSGVAVDLGTPNSDKKGAKKQRRAGMPIAAGVASTTKSPLSQPPSAQQPQYASPAAAVPAMPRSQSAAAVAMLNNMSNDRRALDALGPGPGASAPAPQPLAHGFAPPPAAGPPAHGFGFPPAVPGAAPPGPVAVGAAAPVGALGITLSAVPTHDDLLRAGTRLPEPSPAACGKRKLAEIAAAQMLAGAARAPVAALGGGDAGAVVAGVRGSAATAVGAAAGRDERVWASGGGAVATASEGAALAATPEATDFADAVAALGAVPPVESSSMLPGGLALQIVNPDTLVDQQANNSMSMMAPTRRLLNGQASPLTPWDGQLEALVRSVIYSN